jgi:DNA polymerase/3'-5' exonuclease PolX
VSVRRPLAEAQAVADAVLQRLAPYVKRAVVAGSVRRKRPDCKDIEIVAEPLDVPDGLFGETRPAAQEILDAARAWGPLAKAGEKYIQVTDVLGSGLALDLFLVTPPASWGAILTIRTGPADFSTMMVSKLRGRFMRCEHGRVLGRGGVEVPTPDEEAFFAACGVAYVRPEDRK